MRSPRIFFGWYAARSFSLFRFFLVFIYCSFLFSSLLDVIYSYVVLSCRDAYTVFFAHEETADGRDIYDILDNNSVIAWYACLQDVLPVLTCMNILFQSSLPLPHLLYPRIVEAKATLAN